LLANELLAPLTGGGGLQGFNPHSPLLANELRCVSVMFHFLNVSIHIRHCWRMNSVIAWAGAMFL